MDEPAVAGDPRFASIVRVTAGDQIGTGFYVRADLVLTTHGLAGRSTMVELTTAGGDNVPALVAASDPQRDLALLQMPKPGSAVLLGLVSLGREPLQVLSAWGHGRPVHVSAAPSGSGLEVRAQAGELLHHGLIGAPLFLDQSVVGVLSSAAVGSNEMAAIPAGEILEFLRRYAGPLAALSW